VKKRFLALLLLAVPLLALAETESLAKYRALAKQGDANAEFNIGLIYYDGRSASEEGIWVEAMSKAAGRSIAEAEQIWAGMDSSKKSSAQRDSAVKAAQADIQRKNYKNAAKWFGLAAKHGDAEGQYYLGVLYNRGEGVKKNDATAIQWYRKAAEQGNVNAQSLLGDSYAFGVGLEKNDQTAAKWYRLAAAQGDLVAQQLLACLEPIVTDPSSGAFAHVTQVKQSYENKLPVYHDKQSGKPFTGCTWDRKPNESYPTIMNFVNGLRHGLRTQWAGGPRWHTGWRKYVEENYAAGMQEGPSSAWQHGNDQKSSDVGYISGKKEGIMTYWHEDGSKASEVIFVNGKEDGLSKSWYASGAKRQEANYVNGRIKGPATTWYESGNKSAVKNMDGGLADGLQTRWYENGEKQSEGTIDKNYGFRIGPWTEYYENGQKKSVADNLFSNSTGKMVSTRPELGLMKEWGRVYWTEWYESGQKKTEGFYLHFKPEHIDTPKNSNMANPRHGHWTDWDAEGNATESCYNRGKKLYDSPCGSPEKSEAASTHKRPDTSSIYNLYGNPKNPGYPSLNPESGVLTLTPVDAYGASAVALMKESTTVPFVLTFEFNIWDDDGGTSRGKRWNSADGISVIFAEDNSAYATTVPPAGSAMGFIEDESALGLFFKTFDKRQVFLKDRNGVLARKKEPRVYTDGAWQKARVVVNRDAIIVQFDDRTVLQWQGELPFAAPYVAFGAGTGGSNSRHQVRNVVLSAGQAP
jgi:antitoxin component YwqK of YwqJK toxin-antitoxin module